MKQPKGAEKDLGSRLDRCLYIPRTRSIRGESRLEPKLKTSDGSIRPSETPSVEKIVEEVLEHHRKNCITDKLIGFPKPCDICVEMAVRRAFEEKDNEIERLKSEKDDEAIDNDYGFDCQHIAKCKTCESCLMSVKDDAVKAEREKIVREIEKKFDEEIERLQTRISSGIAYDFSKTSKIWKGQIVALELLKSWLEKEFSTGSEKKRRRFAITTKARDRASVRPEIGGLVTDGKTSLPEPSLSEKSCADKKKEV